MRIDFKSRKKWSYPINVITFNLSRLFPFRNKRIWVFGAWEGKKYDDNSKYLFEYVVEKHPTEIRAIWLSDNENAVHILREKGLEAYLNRSAKGKWFQLRAGVAYYANALIDFGTFPLIGGATIATSWHGMSFKKIYNSKYHGFSLFLKKTLDHVFSWTYRDLSFVPSEQGKRWFEESFTLNPVKIFITGQPRNDTLKRNTRENVFRTLGINPNKKLILYLPTYRQQSLGKDAMLTIAKQLYDNKELDSVLEKTNSVFLVKPHPLTPPIKLGRRDNFVVLDYLSVENNQELLAAGDMLVTDYSGGFIDFALLNRPIIFYEPDEEMFLKYSEDIDKKFFELSNLNKAKTPKDLAELIAEPTLVVCDATNKLWEDESIKDTCYSENVYNVICKEIGLA